MCVHLAVGWCVHLAGSRGPFMPNLVTYSVLGCGYDPINKNFPEHLHWGPMPHDEIPPNVDGILDGLSQVLEHGVVGVSRSCGVEAPLHDIVLVWELKVSVTWCWKHCMTLPWCQVPCVL